MKKSFLSLALLLSAPIVCADAKKASAAKAPTIASLNSDLSIGFVDSFAAMRTCKGGQEAGKQLEAKREKLSTELRTEQEALMKEAAEYQAKQATMSESARENTQKKLAQKERALKGKSEDAEMEMKLAMQKTTDALAKEVEQAVVKVAKQNKLDAVVDTMTGRVLYVENEVNHTASLIKQMDAEHSLQLAKNSKDTAKKVTA